MPALVGEALLVERLEHDVDLLFEHLPVERLVRQDAAEGLDLPGVVAAPDPEDHPPVGEDVRGGEVLGEAQRVPHRADVETAADPQAPGHMREMHPQHEDVRDALVAFVLEVVLGEPQGVEAEPVHRLRKRLGLREHRDEVLVRIAAVVRRGRVLAHVAQIDVARVEGRKLGDHRGFSVYSTRGGGHSPRRAPSSGTYHEHAAPANSAPTHSRSGGNEVAWTVYSPA